MGNAGWFATCTSAREPVAAIRGLRETRPMRIVFALALCGGAACSQQGASQQERVMRAIEKAVQLPAGARPLDQYSRNYASRPDGKIVGIYVISQPADAQASEDGCEVMLKDLGSRPCNEAEKAEIAGQEKAAADLFGQADQSRWFDDYRDLPRMLDGGCDLIEIVFDPKSHRVQSALCNGEA
ncbi:hypothetical protein ABS767_00815 [Sphingomonas sp. ST-64]|uniref:Lipoprotein n=1 Tax=Sphingomonas plantiphila TaxID=3163295 RepID=A0ABW8YGW7_9SPHN